MALSVFERKRREKALDKFMQIHRPPAHVRSRIDIGYRLENQSVIIFEVRPKWDTPEERTVSPVAKATFIKSRKYWKIFYQAKEGKWQAYKPLAIADTLEAFLHAVGEDSHGHFFG